MVKKIKRWYSNLTIYERKEMLLNVFFILYFILVIAFDLLGFFPHSLYFLCAVNGDHIFAFIIDMLFFTFIAVIIFPPIGYHIFNQKLQDELKTNYEKSKKEVEDYFHKSNKTILEIVPKSSKGISDIIDYYHRKGKIVESYWAELDEVNGKAVLYISAIYVGETNRNVYPHTITNFGYLLGNFTFKD